MATSDQIKCLIKAHYENNPEQFKTVVLQIAAHEAKLGHENIARDIKKLLEKSFSNSKIINISQTNPLFTMSMPSDNIKQLIVSEDLSIKISRILKEYLNRKKLSKFGMSNRRKILLEGNPGTGKTFTASVIASELNLPLYTVQMDKLVTKFMGETSVKLRQIFDSVESIEGVYFFDEFDAIGADRNLDNEVGEMRRILNSFLQFIENDHSDSIIIAATNNQQLLDQALFRRFDDILHYSLPTPDEIKSIYKQRICSYQSNFIPTIELIEKSINLSHAEIIKVCDDAIKTSILSDEPIKIDLLLELVYDRILAYKSKEA